jgi:transcriptional regulator with XRE-family HTH domain
MFAKQTVCQTNLQMYIGAMDDSVSTRLYLAFGELVRMHRESRSPPMTQEKLGRLIGLSRTSITNIERGRQHATLHHLFAIAEALSVAPAALLPTAEALHESELDEHVFSKADKDIADWARRVVTK